jgi:hypothetical protein
MAYVGNPIDTQNTFQSLVGKRFNGDGSTTAFTLDVAPSSTLDIEVFVGNVRQDPNSAYTLSGTTLTFTGAPPSGTNNIYVVHQAKSVGTIDPPANSVGVTQLNLSDGSNGQFIQTNGSGTISFASAASALDDISTGDAASTLATSSGNITIDAQGNDTDIIFKGTDGSSDTTFLTLDGSEGGDLTLGANANIVFPATNVVSTGLNTLDDYEEGDWTPACPNVTVAGSEGKYTKIGRLVTVQGFVTLPSTSNVNDVEISGLPFTINNSESGRGGAYITYTTGGSTAITDDGGIFFLGSKNNTLFFASGASGNTTHDNNEYSGKQFYINGQFYTDS